MNPSKPVFDPTNEPEQCLCCNDHPSWEDIAEGLFECNNCGAHINSDGTIAKEPDQFEEEDDLYDEE